MSSSDSDLGVAIRLRDRMVGVGEGNVLRSYFIELWFRDLVGMKVV